LWILAGEPIMDETLYNIIVEKCRQKGFDITKIERTKHSK
jgi:hypothetical protein